MAYHFQGPVRRLISDDGQAYIYYIQEEQGGPPLALGMAWVESLGWIDQETAVAFGLTFGNNEQPWTDGAIWAVPSGTYAWSGGTYAWSGGTYAWSGGTYAWSGGTYAWSGGTYAWSGGTYAWSGGNQPGNTQVSATAWIDD